MLGGDAFCWTLPALLAALLGLSPCSAADGFRGQYFAGTDHDRFALERVDPVVDFVWEGGDSPDWRLAPGRYSIRWTAEAIPPESGLYAFEVVSDGGVRLWVDDVLRIDDWTTRVTRNRTADVLLPGSGPVSLRLEYAHEAGAALIRLTWRLPSGASDLVRPRDIAATEPFEAFLGGAFPHRARQNTRYRAEKVFVDLELEQTTFLVHEPGGTRLYAGTRRGIVHAFENDPEVASSETFLDLGPGVSNLLNMAFHPAYGDPASPMGEHFYVYYVLADRIRLSRFTAVRGENGASRDSEHVLIQQKTDVIDHLGGGLVFGDDGFLYLTIGDLHEVSRAQSLREFFNACVLRIDVDEDPRRSHPISMSLSDWDAESFNRGYGVPDDNPFVGMGAGTFEEYYAIGLRSPHRMTKDRETGELYIADVGSNYEGSFEEVNLLRPGANYGWPFREGRRDITERNVSQGVDGVVPRPPVLIGELSDPIHHYGRSDGSCIIGGYVYRGAALPELRGQYVFADRISGSVWALDLGTGRRERIAAFYSATTFGEDADGELYVGHLQPSLARFSVALPQPEFPERLSDVGAFDDLDRLAAAPGFFPYEVNMPLWSDGAVKRRWAGVPNDGWPNTPPERVVNHKTGAWSFPVGTVLMKHFELEGPGGETRRLETRFLIHGEDEYYGLTYRWREDGSDAELLTDGLDEWVTVGGESQLWHYPSRDECSLCHNPASGPVLSARTAQLNRTSNVSGVGANQISLLAARGLLALPYDDVESLPRLTRRGDGGAYNRDWMRAYLEANCALCHLPDGPGRGTFDTRVSTPLSRQQLFGGLVLDRLGLDDPRVLVAGAPERSVLWYRMLRRDAAAMPPIGSHLVDDLAVDRLASWIETENPRFAESPAAPANQRPLAGSLDIVVSPGLPVDFELPATDPDGDPLDFRLSPPSVGVVSGFGSHRRYLVDEPERPIEIVFHASDGDLESAPGVIRLRPQPVFRRGDANADGVVDVSDAVTILRALLGVGAAIRCRDAGDANDDGEIDVSDAITTLRELYSGREAIPPPGTLRCGVDPSEDDLTCAVYEVCP